MRPLLPLLALAFAAVATSASALDLKAAEAACKRSVLQALPADAKVAAAFNTIYAVGDPQGPANPCRPDVASVARTGEALAALQAEIVRRQDAYDCDDMPNLPVCEGLAGAADRAAALPILPEKTTPAGTLRWEADFKWNLTYGSFGNGPKGVSLYRLVALGAATPGAGSLTPASDFSSFVPPDGDCTANCRRSTAEVMGLYAVLSELDWFYQDVAAGSFRQQAAEAKLVDAQWDAYLFGGGDARVQLPWELLANSVLYKATSHPTEGEFPRPPNTALVLFHPSVGLALKTRKGADSNLVGVVEIVGLGHWTYDSKTGARKNEWGLSAVTTYQPRDNGKDWGYGALLRTPFKGLNVVWTRTKLTGGGHDSQWLFSVDPTSLLPSFGSGRCLFVAKGCD